jgi:hypothetical protein
VLLLVQHNSSSGLIGFPMFFPSSNCSVIGPNFIFLGEKLCCYSSTQISQVGHIIFVSVLAALSLQCIFPRCNESKAATVQYVMSVKKKIYDRSHSCLYEWKNPFHIAEVLKKCHLQCVLCTPETKYDPIVQTTCGALALSKM